MFPTALEGKKDSSACGLLSCAVSTALTLTLCSVTETRLGFEPRKKKRTELVLLTSQLSNPILTPDPNPNPEWGEIEVYPFPSNPSPNPLSTADHPSFSWGPMLPPAATATHRSDEIVQANSSNDVC